MRLKMRYLSKLLSFDSIQTESFLNFHVSKFQILKSPIHSKSSKVQNYKRKIQDTQIQKTQEENKNLVSIFTNITEIIGTQNFISEITEPCGFSISQGTHVENFKLNKEQSHGSLSVCRIDKESKQNENGENLILEDTKLGNGLVNDVSPIVHKITEIIRAENATLPMEEGLENSGFLFDAGIVEKVLKRCFKVGPLAFRFFNWVKLQNGYHHTTSTYNTMIYIAGEAKEFGLVEKLVEEMEMDSCPKDIKTWTILISSYGKGNLIGKALLVFEKMRKAGCEPDGKTYKLIIGALCTARKAEIAMEFYKEMVSKNIKVDMSLYKLLLKCLAGSGDLSTVRFVGDDMINVSQVPEPTVYSSILRCFCISGRITGAIELLHELKIKKITLDPINFEILVKGLCSTGRITEALEIIEIMKQNGFVDGKVYGFVINGYLKKGETADALEMLQRMKELGHIPTLSTYTELMQQLFKLNEYERACKLYEEMLENGVEPDIVAITALVAGHVQHKHISEAWEAFESLKENRITPTQKSYSVFIKELCKVARTEEALKLLNEMRDSKINIRHEIFHLVISSSEKNGDFDTANKAKQMWRASKLFIQESELVCLPTDHQFPSVETKTVVHIPTESHHSLKPKQLQPLSADVGLVEPHSKVYSAHDFQEICKILSASMDWSSMKEALEKCKIQFTPELVLDVLCSCQLCGRASLTFFSWIGEQSGYRHTTQTYNMAIKISGSAKDFKHMRNLYNEMRRKGYLITSETWTIVIMQYGRAGLTEIALKKFEEMRTDGCKPNGNTYKYLLIFLCGKKDKKIDEAIKIFHDMIKDGYEPDKELAEIYLNCLCEVGKLSDARKCREYLCKSGFTVPLSYSLVIRALCRAGRLEEALALADEIGDERSTLDQYIFGSLVHGLLRGGRIDEALDKVERMKQGGIHPTVHVYTSFIVHYFREKQIGKALDIFKKMREEGIEPTIVTYSALIRGYMSMEMVIDAWHIFHRMKLKGPFPDFKTYSMFMNCLCNIGRSEEALQLIDEMLESGIFPSTINFRTVNYGLNREGKKDLAHTVLQKKWELMNKRKFLS